MSIQLFEQKEVHSIWDEEQEKWYFSIVDVVEILTNQPIIKVRETIGKY